MRNKQAVHSKRNSAVAWDAGFLLVDVGVNGPTAKLS
jgi:hypothetical protein